MTLGHCVSGCREARFGVVIKVVQDEVHHDTIARIILQREIEDGALPQSNTGPIRELCLRHGEHPRIEFHALDSGYVIDESRRVVAGATTSVQDDLLSERFRPAGESAQDYFDPGGLPG